MGGNNRSKKAHSSFSIFNFFKFRRGRKEDHCDHSGYWDEMPRSSKVWPSDEDKAHRWVAEPGIDRKAKDYIDKIYRNHVFQSERQTVTLPAYGAKLDV
ncbi:hypothetical protein SDJN03_14653, partial [Cucurbita argyrosperma subsp. sororia]